MDDNAALRRHLLERAAACDDGWVSVHHAAGLELQLCRKQVAGAIGVRAVRTLGVPVADAFGGAWELLAGAGAGEAAAAAGATSRLHIAQEAPAGFARAGVARSVLVVDAARTAADGAGGARIVMQSPEAARAEGSAGERLLFGGVHIAPTADGGSRVSYTIHLQHAAGVLPPDVADALAAVRACEWVEALARRAAASATPAKPPAPNGSTNGFGPRDRHASPASLPGTPPPCPPSAAAPAPAPAPKKKRPQLSATQPKAITAANLAALVCGEFASQEAVRESGALGSLLRLIGADGGGVAAAVEAGEGESGGSTAPLPPRRWHTAGHTAGQP